MATSQEWARLEYSIFVTHMTRGKPPVVEVCVTLLFSVVYRDKCILILTQHTTFLVDLFDIGLRVV